MDVEKAKSHVASEKAACQSVIEEKKKKIEERRSEVAGVTDRSILKVAEEANKTDQEIIRLKMVKYYELDAQLGDLEKMEHKAGRALTSKIMLEGCYDVLSKSRSSLSSESDVGVDDDEKNIEMDGRVRRVEGEENGGGMSDDDEDMLRRAVAMSLQSEENDVGVAVADGERRPRGEEGEEYLNAGGMRELIGNETTGGWKDGIDEEKGFVKSQVEMNPYREHSPMAEYMDHLKNSTIYVNGCVNTKPKSLVSHSGRAPSIRHPIASGTTQAASSSASSLPSSAPSIQNLPIKGVRGTVAATSSGTVATTTSGTVATTTRRTVATSSGVNTGVQGGRTRFYTRKAEDEAAKAHEEAKKKKEADAKAKKEKEMEVKKPVERPSGPVQKKLYTRDVLGQVESTLPPPEKLGGNSDDTVIENDYDPTKETPIYVEGEQGGGGKGGDDDKRGGGGGKGGDDEKRGGGGGKGGDGKSGGALNA